MTCNPSPKLLSCQFCGLPAEIVAPKYEVVDGKGWFASCSNRTKHDDQVCYVYGATEADAIAAWNTRALSPQTLPAPGEVDYAEMLQTAWESCPSGEGLGLPPIIFSDAEAAHIVKSLATVAAANDEGVADAGTIKKPHTAGELCAIIRTWLDADCDWGAFEKSLDRLIEKNLP